jgi:thymidylate synthase (FAD)
MSRVRTPVLDHGYVQLVEVWGSDSSIIEAARMSTAKGFQGWGTPEKPGDEKLLAYLYRHKHMTPFEMCGAIFEIKAPIFVFREWHRHRTQSYNEMSARYIPLPDENYLPGLDNVVLRSGANANKQASGSKKITPEQAANWLHNMKQLYELIQAEYKFGLELGVPKELARICLPVGRYSAMRASANLRNWMQFLELRCAAGAQEEIRLYAEAVLATLELDFPRTIALFRNKDWVVP